MYVLAYSFAINQGICIDYCRVYYFRENSSLAVRFSDDSQSDLVWGTTRTTFILASARYIHGPKQVEDGCAVSAPPLWTQISAREQLRAAAAPVPVRATEGFHILVHIYYS